MHFCAGGLWRTVHFGLHHWHREHILEGRKLKLKLCELFAWKQIYIFLKMSNHNFTGPTEKCHVQYVHVAENRTCLIVCLNTGEFIYEQSITMKPELTTYLFLHRVNRWLICSVWWCLRPVWAHRPFIIISFGDTDQRKQKYTKEKSSFSVYDDESTHHINVL